MGLKKLKISCKEKEFLSIFNKNNLISIKSVAEQKFWILITKYILNSLEFSHLWLYFFRSEKGL